MPVQITIRGVPEKVRDELAARAALRGQSMQEFLRGELERIASRPSLDALRRRVRDRKRASGPASRRPASCKPATPTVGDGACRSSSQFSTSSSFVGGLRGHDVR